MKLRPASPSPVNAMNRAALSAPSSGKTTGVPQDAIRISGELETLNILQAGQATKVARITARAYQVGSAAISKSIVEDALSQ